MKQTYTNNLQRDPILAIAVINLLNRKRGEDKKNQVIITEDIDYELVPNKELPPPAN